MKRRLFSFMLVLALCLCLLPSAAFAEAPGQAEAEEYSAESAAEAVRKSLTHYAKSKQSVPTEIKDWDDLDAFRDWVNAGNSGKGMSFKLEKNINLGYEEWTPIGNVPATNESEFRKPAGAFKTAS